VSRVTADRVPEPVLDVVHVSATYDAALGDALLDASLTIARGELVAVVGPNGAGKSTLLRVLAGTLAPHRGDVRLFGAPMSARTRQEIARDVAVVAQSEEVRFAFSVREVVMMGRAPHQRARGVPSPADVRLVEDALVRCDLGDLRLRPVDQLSGGEKKRVAIARAFAQSPSVMLLDEPTAFLDVRHQIGLFAELHAMVDAGMACAVVTHDLQLAAAHACRVVLVHGGRLVASGPVDEVLTPRRLEAVFGCEMDVGTFGASSTRVFAPRANRLAAGAELGRAVQALPAK
jgi:iron complex transport system ATP-binding protein